MRSSRQDSRGFPSRLGRLAGLLVRLGTRTSLLRCQRLQRTHVGEIFPIPTPHAGTRRAVIHRLRVHGQVVDKPGSRKLSEIKLMKDDAAGVEAQAEEIKARYAKLFGV